jgi:uncharacterized membrane protein YhaH (DUF805 family)
MVPNYWLAPWKKYADFSGRARRTEYWYFIVQMMIYAVVFGIVFGLLAAVIQDQTALFLIMAVFYLPLLGAIVPGIAVSVRRFHDLNKSGVEYLLWILASMVPFVNFVTGIIMLVFMCTDGTPGPNKFGEDPKGRAAVIYTQPTPPAPMG